MLAPFHLAIPVSDLKVTRAFYNAMTKERIKDLDVLDPENIEAKKKKN